MRLGILFLLLGFLPLSAQNAQLAGMQQDLADLRTEVEKLKLENADLRAALSRQKAGQGQSASTSESVAKARAEILGEVDRRLKQQTDDVNAALAELTRQVNAALGKSSATPATRRAIQVASFSAATNYERSSRLSGPPSASCVRRTGWRMRRLICARGPSTTRHSN